MIRPFSPEVVGKVPEEVFTKISNYIQEPMSGGAFEVRWPEGEYANRTELALLPILEPITSAIEAREVRALSFILYSVGFYLVLPNRPAREHQANLQKWHRDQDFTDRFNTSEYVTANCLPTEFKHFEPEPYDLVRFAWRKHRAPINRTNKPVSRVWIRAFART